MYFAARQACQPGGPRVTRVVVRRTKSRLSSRTLNVVAAFHAMSRPRCYISFASALIALIFAAPELWSAEVPTLASIVQTDGMLLPFAEYKDGSWKTTWVTDEAPPVSGWAASDNPAYQKSMPLSDVPQKWTGYPSNRLARWYLSSVARHNATLHVDHAGMFPIHCGQTWGLATDMPKRSWKSFPIQKAGVAFTSPQEFHGMMSVVRKGKRFATLSSYVRSVFGPLHQKAVEDYTGPQAPQSNVEIRAWATESPIDGRTWYYVQARRSYGVARDAEPAAKCELISFLTAWLEGAESHPLKMISHRFFKTDCDMQAVSTEQPFGVLHLEGRNYLFTQINGYEDETYRISTVDSEGLHSVLEASGGGC